MVLGVAEAAGVGAAFVATQPIDPAIKGPVCGILGCISLALNAFWLKYVNVTQPQQPSSS